MYSSGMLARRLAAVAGAGLAAAAITAPVVNAAGSHTTAAARMPDAATAGGTMPYQNPKLPIAQRVQDLLSRMTIAEKIGQMTQPERGSIDTDTSKITTDNLGSLLSGGGSVPTPNSPRASADMVDRYQRAALATRLHIPITYGIDTVHGDGNMYGATVEDPRLVREMETAIDGFQGPPGHVSDPTASWPPPSTSRATA